MESVRNSLPQLFGPFDPHHGNGEANARNVIQIVMIVVVEQSSKQGNAAKTKGSCLISRSRLSVGFGPSMAQVSRLLEARVLRICDGLCLETDGE